MIRGISSTIHVATKDHTIFVSNFTQKLITLNHMLDLHFDIRKCDFVINVEDNMKNYVIETVMFCNNLRRLTEYVKENR